LPLHVVNCISATTSDRHNVVDHETMAAAPKWALGGWAGMRGFEFSLGPARSDNAAIDHAKQSGANERD
jgi:hypothetical protein